MRERKKDRERERGGRKRGRERGRESEGEREWERKREATHKGIGKRDKMFKGLCIICWTKIKISLKKGAKRSKSSR